MKIAAVLSLLMLTGCASYTHTRELADGKREKTSFRAFLIWGNAAKITSKTLDSSTNYSRTMSVGSLQGGTEAEKINGIAEAIASGVAKGLKP